MRILREIDVCRAGEVGAILRREGLYSSHLTKWRQEREESERDALSPKKRGRKAKEADGAARRVAELERGGRKTDPRADGRGRGSGSRGRDQASLRSNVATHHQASHSELVRTGVGPSGWGGLSRQGRGTAPAALKSIQHCFDDPSVFFYTEITHREGGTAHVVPWASLYV